MGKRVLALVGLSLVLLLACGGGHTPSEVTAVEAEVDQVRGRILEVVGRNITEIETLRILDEMGKEWAFTTEEFVGFTPSHLQEHQLFGQTILVSYVEKNGRLVAVNLSD